MLQTETAELSSIAGKQGSEAEGKSAGNYFEYKINQELPSARTSPLSFLFCKLTLRPKKSRSGIKFRASARALD